MPETPTVKVTVGEPGQDGTATVPVTSENNHDTATVEEMARAAAHEEISDREREKWRDEVSRELAEARSRQEAQGALLTDMGQALAAILTALTASEPSTPQNSEPEQETPPEEVPPEEAPDQAPEVLPVVIPEQEESPEDQPEAATVIAVPVKRKARRL